MRIFVDCEFTDFIGCDLISIGLIADDGREFYGERSDYDDTACSGFVREAVLPQLGRQHGCVFPREGLRVSLLAWLDQFAGEPERTFCVDYAGDWDLLIDLLGEVPEGWEGLHVGSLVDHGRLEAYFAEHGGRHHALMDARASRFAVVPDRDGATPAVPMAQVTTPRIF
jgi:3' exoribonuclease, RNase T-like